MAKKILCVIMLLLSLVCVLASCNDGNNDTPTHTHSYGEWETVKNPTCTTEGSKERYCSCGEKQTANISATGHCFGEWTVTQEPTEQEKGIETRCCTCGTIETKDIPTKKPQTQTSQLSMLEFCSELEAYLEATRNQPSFSYVISDIYGDDPFTYCTIYFNGEQTLIQDNAHDTRIFGKVGTEYVDMNVDEKTYTEMSESEFEELVDTYRKNMLSDIEYFPDEVKKGTNFECQKLTNDNKITYFVKCSVEYGGVFGTVNYRTTIKVENGVIIEYEDPELEEIILTYPNDVVVELPDLSDYTRE